MCFYKEYIRIDTISVHKVGNKTTFEGISFSAKPIIATEDVLNVLKSYFLFPFKKEEYYHFYHPNSLNFNEVYTFCVNIFANVELFHEQSKMLAKLLYDCSEHPNIKSGEFYVVYFKNCILDGETVDAIGLFKSENKDTFIRINAIDDGFSVESESGININKLDKGCLIFNTHREDGYVVSVVDKTNKGEAKYWIEDFLLVKRQDDDYTQTQNTMTLCREFVRQMPNADSIEKAQIVNRVYEGLRSNKVDVEELLEDAFGKKIAETQFVSYRSMYEDMHHIKISDHFTPKIQAINRRSTSSLTTIRLDDNFEVKLLNSHAAIERGYDNLKEMLYYKLWFEKEN